MAKQEQEVKETRNDGRRVNHAQGPGLKNTNAEAQDLKSTHELESGLKNYC